MKISEQQKLTVNLHTSCAPEAIIRCEDYSDLRRLLRVTAYVLKFIQSLKKSRAQAPQQKSQTQG